MPIIGYDQVCGMTTTMSGWGRVENQIVVKIKKLRDQGIEKMINLNVEVTKNYDGIRAREKLL